MNIWCPVFPDAPSNLYQRYRFERKPLGKGYAGTVKACVDKKTGERLACKTIKKSRLDCWDAVEDIRREVEAIKSLAGHPHVVRLREVYEDSVSVHLVTELCNGGELFDWINANQGLPELEALRLFRQLAEAVAACHEKGWIHRDLKPENVLLTCAPASNASTVCKGNGGVMRAPGKEDQAGPAGEAADSARDRAREADEYPPASATGTVASLPAQFQAIEAIQSMQIRLADFGMAIEQSSDPMARGTVGSPFYMAPEVVTNSAYDFKADIWSLGVVLYAMLSGDLPFNGGSTSATYRLIKRGKVVMNCDPWPLISDEVKDLVLQLLQADPTKRPTAVEILQHPWCRRGMGESSMEAELGTLVRAGRPTGGLEERRRDASGAAVALAEEARTPRSGSSNLSSQEKQKANMSVRGSGCHSAEELQAGRGSVAESPPFLECGDRRGSSSCCGLRAGSPPRESLEHGHTGRKAARGLTQLLIGAPDSEDSGEANGNRKPGLESTMQDSLGELNLSRLHVTAHSRMDQSQGAASAPEPPVDHMDLAFAFYGLECLYVHDAPARGHGIAVSEERSSRLHTPTFPSISVTGTGTQLTTASEQEANVCPWATTSRFETPPQSNCPTPALQTPPKSDPTPPSQAFTAPAPLHPVSQSEDPLPPRKSSVSLGAVPSAIPGPPNPLDAEPCHASASSAAPSAASSLQRPARGIPPQRVPSVAPPIRRSGDKHSQSWKARGWSFFQKLLHVTSAASWLMPVMPGMHSGRAAAVHPVAIQG